MFSYWFLHVFFPIWGRIPVYKRVRTNVIPLVCMAIWLLYIYIHRGRYNIYILYGSYMSYRDLQCLGCTSKSHNIIMFSPTVRFPSSQEFSAFFFPRFSQFLVGHPGLQLRLRAPAEGGSGSPGDQTRLPQCGGRGGTCRLSDLWDRCHEDMGMVDFYFRISHGTSGEMWYSKL